MTAFKQYDTPGPGRRTGAVPQDAVIWQPEASGETHLQGAPVVLTSGYINECASNPASIYGLALAAGANSSADGANDIPVLRALPGLEYAFSIDTTSYTVDMVGSYFALTQKSSSWCAYTVATSASSIAQLRLEGVPSYVVAGDDYPVGYFTLLSSKIQNV